MIEVHGEYLGPGSFIFFIKLDVPEISETYMPIDEYDILIEEQLRKNFPDENIEHGYIYVSSWNKIAEKK